MCPEQKIAEAATLRNEDDFRRQAIMEEAVMSLRRQHPGQIVTKGRNHVLLASA